MGKSIPTLRPELKQYIQAVSDLLKEPHLKLSPGKSSAIPFKLCQCLPSNASSLELKALLFFVWVGSVELVNALHLNKYLRIIYR